MPFIEDMQAVLGANNGFTFLHQIHAIVEDRSKVDLEIEVLRKENKVRRLSCCGASREFSDIEILMDSTRYLNDAQRAITSFAAKNIPPKLDETSTSLAQKFTEWLSSTSKCSFISSDLCPSIFSFAEAEYIIRLGLFRATVTDSTFSSESKDGKVGTIYVLSHPAVGKLVNDMINAEKYILSAISRTKYKEIYERELIQRVEKKSAPSKRRKLDEELYQTSSSPKLNLLLPMTYYILDLVGRGKIRRIRNPSDTDFLIRGVKS